MVLINKNVFQIIPSKQMPFNPPNLATPAQAQHPKIIIKQPLKINPSTTSLYIS